MNPIFFPFTYISEQVAKKITTCLRPLTVYLPSSESVPQGMKELEKNNLLDLRIPIEKDEDKLKIICEEYIEWGKIHKKNTISSLKHRSATPPLFDNSWTSQLKTAIKNYSENPSTEKTDSEFNDRIFLKVAQEHDRHNIEIQQNFEIVENMEQNLFKDLRADDFHLISKNTGRIPHDSEDPGAYMTRERLAAWFTILTKDCNIPSSLFFTTSPAIWDFIMNSSPEAQTIEKSHPIITINTAKENQTKTLSKFLTSLQEEKWSSDQTIPNDLRKDNNENQISLKLSIIPDQTPQAYFSRFSIAPRNDVLKNQTSNRNTILGILI